MTRNQKLGLVIDPITRIQNEYLNDREHRFFVIPPGRRSRKTIIGNKKVLWSALSNKDHKYFFAAPTRDQANKIFWNRLVNQCKALNQIKSIDKTLLRIFLLNGTMLNVVGLDAPERIEGETPSWNGGLITEFPNCKPEAWSDHIRPALSDTLGFCIMDGVPEGMNFYYDLAEYACGGRLPVTLPGIGAKGTNPNDPEWVYYHWFSSDVLPETEIEAAKRTSDERTYRQEYEGAFVNVTNFVYYCFSDKNIVKKEFNPNLNLIMSWDFNATDKPMATTLIQEEQGKIYVVKEFFNKNTNTNSQCQIITEYLKSKNFKANITVTGDYMGVAMHSSASYSDYYIIESYFKNYNYIRKIRPTKRIKDRTDALNSLLKNSLDENRLFIDSECKNLIQDFYKTQWKSGLFELDESRLERTHLTDTASFFAYNFYPLREEMEVR